MHILFGQRQAEGRMKLARLLQPSNWFSRGHTQAHTCHRAKQGVSKVVWYVLNSFDNIVAVNLATEQVDTASPASSFDFNDFPNEAVDLNFPALGSGGYANTFLMPDVPMDLDAFTESFGWVSN